MYLMVASGSGPNLWILCERVISRQTLCRDGHKAVHALENRRDVDSRFGSRVDFVGRSGEVRLKFKLVFVLFNAVIVVSFLVIYLMPLAMLGWDYTQAFWSRNWGLPLLFGSILLVLNGYFGFNWKLFRLLEREDWDGLILHLEARIFERKIIFAQHCRILINSYLVRSRLESMERLESLLRGSRPRILRRIVMPVGVRHLLSNDARSMSGFFGEWKDARIRDSGWIKWCYAFARLLDEDREEAKVYLLLVANTIRNPLLLLLSLYLLDTTSPPDVGLRSQKLKAKYGREKISAEIEHQRGGVQVVILSKLIDEATAWLYRPAPDLH